MWVIKKKYNGKGEQYIFSDVVIEALKKDEPDFFTKYFEKK